MRAARARQTPRHPETARPRMQLATARHRDYSPQNALLAGGRGGQVLRGRPGGPPPPLHAGTCSPPDATGAATGSRPPPPVRFLPAAAPLRPPQDGGPGCKQGRGRCRAGRQPGIRWQQPRWPGWRRSEGETGCSALRALRPGRLLAAGRAVAAGVAPSLPQLGEGVARGLRDRRRPLRRRGSARAGLGGCFRGPFPASSPQSRAALGCLGAGCEAGGLCVRGEAAASEET